MRVKPHSTPQAGWGAVKKTSVGIVKGYDSKQNNKVCQYLYFCTYSGLSTERRLGLLRNTIAKRRTRC